MVAAQTEHFKLADKLDEMEKAMKLMDTSVRVFQAISERRQDIRDIQQANTSADDIVAHIERANDTFQAATEFGLDILNDTEDAVLDAMPDTTIVGMANGGNFLAPAKLGIAAAFTATEVAIGAKALIADALVRLLRVETDLGIELREFHEIDVKEWEIEKIEQVRQWNSLPSSMSWNSWLRRSP